VGLGEISRKKAAVGIAVLVIVVLLPWNCQDARAQSIVAFNPATKFSVPAYNATVNFLFNGTYTNAVFSNNTWTFTNLNLQYSPSIGNLSVSARNCNVTIYYYQMLNPRNYFSTLRFHAEGKGIQMLNLHLKPETGGLQPSAEWSVSFGNGTFATVGHGWTISRDGTLTISGAHGNVTVFHNGILSGSFLGSNLPFYEQHSVAIAVAAGAVAVLAAAVIVNVNIRRRKDDLV